MRKGQGILPLLFSLLAFMTFLRIPGARNVSTVQILSLIATGLCLGVGVAHLLLPRAKSQP